MKAQDVHNMTNEELAQKLESLKEELFNLRVHHATHPLENPNGLHSVKKDIARVKTVIREREIKKA